MVHRDLSATNVLLDSSLADDRGFRVLLADFGAFAEGMWLVAGGTGLTGLSCGTLLRPDLC
jgi:serine/threonine protein kinase